MAAHPDERTGGPRRHLVARRVTATNDQRPVDRGWFADTNWLPEHTSSADKFGYRFAPTPAGGATWGTHTTTEAQTTVQPGVVMSRTNHRMVRTGGGVTMQTQNVATAQRGWRERRAALERRQTRRTWDEAAGMTT